MKRQVGTALSDTMLTASFVKILDNSGARYLPTDTSLHLTDSILYKILQSTTLHPSKKLDFFRWFTASPHHPTPSPSSYSFLLSLLSRSGFLRDAVSLLPLARRSSVPLPLSSFHRLLLSATSSGDLDVAFEVLDSLESSGFGLSSDICNPILVTMVRKGHISSALSMFFKLLEDPEQTPTSSACNELLVGLRKLGMRAEFEAVFDGIRRKNVGLLNVTGYNICIHAFGVWGDLGISLKLFKEMKGFGRDPNSSTYNSLLRALCCAGKLDDALVVYQELKASVGQEPTSYTYRIMIQGCCKSYRIRDAAQIFAEMRCSGFRADTVVYNSFMDGLLKARKLEDAFRVFEEMVEDGVRATSWTYNILIDGLFKNGRAHAGFAMFCDLKKKGQFVDEITYSIIVVRLCKEGLIGEAIKLVEEMEERGFVVDLVTITSLLVALYRKRRWDLTDKLVKYIRSSNLSVEVLKWKLDMEASMKAPQSKAKDNTPMFPSKGEFSEIMNLIQSVDSSIREEDVHDSAKSISSVPDEWSSSLHMDKLADQFVYPDNLSRLFTMSRGKRVEEKGSFDINMVNTFLSIFLAKGKLSIACKLFEIFSAAGVDPVSYTYNSMMTSFVKRGYFNEAWSVLDAMGEKFCPVDIATYNVIIQGLGNMGRADLAKSVLDKLMEGGGYLDLVMYNTLINALGKNGRLDEACKMFEQMKGGGINPDTVTFNILIEVHAKAGHLDDAYGFLKMMIAADCPPNHITDSILDYLEKEMEKQRNQNLPVTSSSKDDKS